VLGALSELYAMSGQFERARDAYLRARSIFEELGNRLLASAVSTNAWRVEWLAGDPAAAVRLLQHDLEALATLGEQQLRSFVAATLANLLTEMGDLDGSDALSRESERIAEEDDVATQSGWRLARAGLLAARGSADEALALAEAAVAMLRETDTLHLLADGLLQQASVLRTTRRHALAIQVAAEAASLYERKGDVVGLARAASAVTDAAEAFAQASRGTADPAGA
jgi:tetratricopeptide (TPR) repeat protein